MNTIIETVAVTVCMWATLPHQVKNQMISVDTFPTSGRVQPYGVATTTTNCQVHPYCSDTFPTNNPTQMFNVVCLFNQNLPGPRLVFQFRLATNHTTFQQKTVGIPAKTVTLTAMWITFPNRVYLK